MSTKFYERQKSTQPFPHPDIHHEEYQTHRFVRMHGTSFIPDEEDHKRITESRRCAEIQRWLRKEQCKYFFSMRCFSVWPVKVLIQTVMMTLMRPTSPMQVAVNISTPYLWAPDSVLCDLESGCTEWGPLSNWWPTGLWHHTIQRYMLSPSTLNMEVECYCEIECWYAPTSPHEVVIQNINLHCCDNLRS